MKWLIYKHINKINGKVYIGQTKQSVAGRWRNGLGYFHKKYTSVFCRAIKKYGWDNFSHEVIEDDIATQELANNREIYWIAVNNSYIGFDNSNGYNMTLGGNSAEHLGYPVYQIEKNTYKIVREFPSTAEASRFFGKSSNDSCIRMCCEGRKVSCKGYYWCYKSAFKNGWRPKDNELVSPIYQINDDFEVVREFTSITEAHNKFGYSAGTIVQCCRLKCRKANGYYWCYKSDYSADWKPAELSFKRREKIYCFEKNEVYRDSLEASIKTGINRGSILKCCSHRELNAAGGLHFCFYSEKSKYIIRNNFDESPVVCINTSVHYKTINEAALHTGTRASGISSCCRGKNKTANGLSWCYESSYKENSPINDPREKGIICVSTKQKYKSIVDASRQLGIPVSTLCAAVKHSTPTRGLYFCYEKDFDKWTPAVNKTKRPVFIVETKEIFESARDAERKTGISFGSIFQSIKKGGTAGGFHWKYYTN